MKRSEMVDKMTQVWLGVLPGQECQVYDEVHMMMENLLSHIEHSGMLPPPNPDSDAVPNYEWEAE